MAWAFGTWNGNLGKSWIILVRKWEFGNLGIFRFCGLHLPLGFRGRVPWASKACPSGRIPDCGAFLGPPGPAMATMAGPHQSGNYGERQDIRKPIVFVLIVCTTDYEAEAPKPNIRLPEGSPRCLLVSGMYRFLGQVTNNASLFSVFRGCFLAS